MSLHFGLETSINIYCVHNSTWLYVFSKGHLFSNCYKHFNIILPYWLSCSNQTGKSLTLGLLVETITCATPCAMCIVTNSPAKDFLFWYFYSIWVAQWRIQAWLGSLHYFLLPQFLSWHNHRVVLLMYVQSRTVLATDQTFRCSCCSRACLSRIGLVSHERTCSRLGSPPS